MKPMPRRVCLFRLGILAFLIFPCPTPAVFGETIDADLLVVGGDESGCAAAVQAARLGVAHIVLVNDTDWLGGQFCTQGIGPIDEWTIVEGKRTEFPASGAFQEILDRIHDHNRSVYGIARPGNGWCGSNTIEPRAAAKIFEEWLAAYAESGTRQIRVLRRLQPMRVIVADGRVTGVAFTRTDDTAETLHVNARLTVDASDWGDVIRLSGASFMAGPDLRSRYREPSAPESIDPAGQQEMNPISFCPLLRESGEESTIARPARYDARSFAEWQKTPMWVDWDGSGGIYNKAGWSIYTHRRMVDRRHFGLAAGTEAIILNWPAQDYPLCTLPRHVVDALEADEIGASQKNIVTMTHPQRRIVFDDARQRALEFVYWLQTAADGRSGDVPHAFQSMRLADDYGTPDMLPPKPYVREGLRLDALYVLREQDVRTPEEKPLWARAMVPDGVFGYQFNIDFHPTRRTFVDDDPARPWQPSFHGTRNWNSHTDRAMFPLRGLVPLRMDGLLGCSKNIGVTSLVQSSLRLHGQMMHVGTAAGTVAAHALRDRVQPRAIAASPQRIREVQARLVRGAGGPGTLLWPWHDLRPDDGHFEAANLLTIAGIWRADPDSLFFRPRQVVTRRELACSLARLVRALPDAPEWPDYPEKPLFSDVPAGDDARSSIEAVYLWGTHRERPATFEPDAAATWGVLNQWFAALRLPTFPSLAVANTGRNAGGIPLTRSECVDYLSRVLRLRGEFLPPDASWLQPWGDDDGDGRKDHDDPLPWDRDNDNVIDRLQAPNLALTAPPFGRRVLVSDYGGNRVAIIAADGRVEWHHPCEKPQDVWMLANGNVLFSHVRGAREVTRGHEVAWQYESPQGTEVHGCQPLPGGQVLVVECGTRRLVEVDREGRIAREIPVPVKTAGVHDQMRGCRRTSDGRYLVSAKGDRAVLELGRDGTLLRTLKTPGDPHEVRELPGGRILVACGEGEALLEFDREGAVVWKLGSGEVPNNPLRLVSGFQRLPNGHTVVVNWLGHGYLATTTQFFELDAAKRIVRQFTDHGRFVSINKVQLLDVPGDPARDEIWR
jgi:hypothetical protein